jgi:hypothetical protein
MAAHESRSDEGIQPAESRRVDPRIQAEAPLPLPPWETNSRLPGKAAGFPWLYVIIGALLSMLLMVLLFQIDVSEPFGMVTGGHHGPYPNMLPPPRPVLTVTFGPLGKEIYAATRPKGNIDNLAWWLRVIRTAIGVFVGGFVGELVGRNGKARRGLQAAPPRSAEARHF